MITLTHATFGRTPLDEISAHHRDLYLTTFSRDGHPRTLVGFEPTIPPSQQLHTNALVCMAAGISMYRLIITNNFRFQARMQSCKMCLLASSFQSLWMAHQDRFS